jgi:hypothetical protein
MKSLATLLLLLILASAAWADHAPEWLISTASPDLTLAGFTVGASTVGDVVLKYGEPTSADPSPEGYETEYNWTRNGYSITALTMHPLDAARDKQVVLTLEVRGDWPEPNPSTGAGAALGSTLQDLVHLYGGVYMTHWRSISDESATVTFIFEDETELSFGFSRSGRVYAIRLAGSVE